jgi:polyhydroxyalkanoate synthesis regulator phasin
MEMNKTPSSENHRKDTDMNLIRKVMLGTLGAISITKAEAEEIVDELVARGETSEMNRSEMMERLLKEAETQKDEIGRKVLAATQKSVSDLGLSTQKDFKGIERRLAEIEKALDAKQQDKVGATS